MFHQWITEYLNSECVPYPPGAPSVRAGRITLCCLAIGTWPTMRCATSSGSSVLQVHRDARRP